MNKKKTDVECYHEDTTFSPRSGGRVGETVCDMCGEEFLYCHSCSKAGGADMPIYHAAPICEDRQ